MPAGVTESPQFSGLVLGDAENSPSYSSSPSPSIKSAPSPIGQKYVDGGDHQTCDTPASLQYLETGAMTCSCSISKQLSGTQNNIRNLIPTAQGGITVVQVVVLIGVIGVLTWCPFICLSGVTGVSYHAYNVFMGLDDIWYFILGSGLFGAICLHAMNFYTWRLRVKAVLMAMVLYSILMGCACHAKTYPSAPGLVVISQCPIMLGMLRYHSAVHLHISAHSFFLAAANCFFVNAAIVLLAWTYWVIADDMTWGIATKEKLRNRLKDGGVFARYGLENWDQCINERSLSPGANQSLLSYCSRIELTSFLVWGCPLVECLILSIHGVFCVLRHRMLVRGASLPERTLRLILFLMLMLASAFWIACSTAGASMGLSRAVLGCVALACVTVGVWMLFVVDLEAVLTVAKGTVIYKTIEPAVRSDYFNALLLFFNVFFILSFLFIEFLSRQVERLRGFPGSGNAFLTVRGVAAATQMRKKHWAVTLEKTFNLCMLYLVFFLCARFTPVFVSWLDDALKLVEFSKVCVVFYVVGLIMFLLPPVPGVPVYIAAGTIIVSRGKHEPWLGFWTGIAFSSVLGLVLKLNAVAMQQKLIGQAFGRSLYIQQLVGVHTTSIRAIEKILKRPGLTLEKVAILCGGPDWPTSVLTGILGLSLRQMLLGTLPCFFLIIPCVLGGSSLHEDNLRSLSPLLIMMVGTTQGGMMLAALIFIAKETEKNYSELSEPREEHKELLEKAREVSQRNACYRSATTWDRLGYSRKVLLLVSVALELSMCWVCFFIGGLCFRTFSIGNDINASFEDGGLSEDGQKPGKVSNMVRPNGVLVFYAIGVGLLLFIMYKCIGGRSSSRCETDPEPE